MQGLEHGLLGNAVVGEDPLHAALGGFQQTQEQVFHGDKFVLHGAGLCFGGSKGCIHVGTDIEPVSFPAAGDGRNFAQLRFRGGFQTLHRHIHLLQQLRHKTSILLQQSHQQMNLLHLLIAVLNCKVFGVLDSLHGLLRIVLKIHSHPSFMV